MNASSRSIWAAGATNGSFPCPKKEKGGRIASKKLSRRCSRDICFVALIQIVGYNRQPISVDEFEIAAIQTLVASGLPNQLCSFVEIGDRVRIQSGPLYGLEGILVESRGRHKFVLSVSLLQRSVAVEIDALSVTPCRRDSVSTLREISAAVTV
jgi:hypothetical protein